MSKQVNYPYTINTLSAKGSAEVIARGINNDYITQWSLNTNTIDSWDNVENFPTVVRTGNFVWCWYREYSNRAIYILIDVVPDPEVEYQLGNNIAYPALLNGSVGEITNAATSASVETDNMAAAASTVTDGPYYPLTVAGQYNHVANASDGYKSGFYDTGRRYKEIVADKWGDTPGVWGGFAVSNGQYAPWLVGWGGLQTLLTSTNGDDGDAIQGIFAPFATYEQFQTLYGAESDWIHSTHGSTYKTLFATAYDASNGAGKVYSNPADIENDYPFTVEAMQPQTKYRNIPGDTNGDGFDDTPSLEDALAVYGAVAGAFPGLDITKCGNLADLGLKVGDIDIPSINELKNSVKAAVDSAVDSIGLSKIDEMVQGFKDGLNDMLPDTTQIENLAKDISDLKDKGEDAYQKLVEKWDGLVDDIEGVIDSVRNLGGFDICQFVTDKAKTDDDGKLVKKEKAPSPPDRPIVPAERGFIRPMPQDSVSQDDVQNNTGYNEEMARAAREIYNEEWRKLLLDPFIQFGSQSSNSGSIEPISDVDQAGIDLANILGEDNIPKSFDGMGAFTSNSAADFIDPVTGIASYIDDAGVNRIIRDPKDNIPTAEGFYLGDPEIESIRISAENVKFDEFGKQTGGLEEIYNFKRQGLTRGQDAVDITGGNRTNDEVRSNPTGFRPDNTTANQNKTEGVNYSEKEPITTRHDRLLHTPEYQTAKAQGSIQGLQTWLKLEEKDTFKDYYRIQYFESLVAGAREQIENALFKSTNSQITPDIKSVQLWTPVEYVEKGALYPGAIVSTVDQDDVNFFDKLINKLHSLIDEKILVVGLLAIVEQITAGEIDSTRVRGTATPQAKKDSTPVTSTATPQAKAEEGLDPRWPSIIKRARELGADFRITEGYRSPERQNQLYAQGRTTPGPIVTYVRGGRSKHQTGRAIDIVWQKGKGINNRNPKGTLYDPVELEKMARLFQQAGREQGVTVKWGGDFKTFYDGPHLEIAG